MTMKTFKFKDPEVARRFRDLLPKHNVSMDVHGRVCVSVEKPNQTICQLAEQARAEVEETEITEELPSMKMMAKKQPPKSLLVKE